MADRRRAPWVPQKAEERLERSSQILQIRTFILYVTQPKGVRFDPALLASLRPRARRAPWVSGRGLASCSCIRMLQQVLAGKSYKMNLILIYRSL
jgi:hypothetical protein